MCLYAPDVTVGPDGRYYLYYVLDKVSVVSVAVCDTPAGEYEFYGYVQYPDGTKLGDKEWDEPQFDPGVITEGDITLDKISILKDPVPEVEQWLPYSDRICLRYRRNRKS